jgi:hydroxymethylbilane synthase
MKDKFIIATRGSDLALWQANHVKSRLEEAGLRCELKIIRTKGDEIQHVSLEKIEGKGFFTKEIEEALLSGDADIAVHSHKDLPTESPAGLMLAAITDREDPSEYLLIRKEAVDLKQKFSLKRNAKTGTSSSRRKSQLMAFRSDLVLDDLRGNVPTRIRKLREGQFDAILIAAAGVERLGLDISDLHVEKLDPKEFIPAPAQGVLAIQIRDSDETLKAKLQVLHHPLSAALTAIERKLLNLFHGGCHMPVGAFATHDEETGLYTLRATRSESWDKLPVSIFLESKNPDLLAGRVFEKLKTAKPCHVFISRNKKNGRLFCECAGR